MTRRMVSTAVVALALCAAATISNAQPLAAVSAGISIPSGEYGDYAETGWVAGASLLFPVGRPGLHLGGRLMLGSNSHKDIDGDKTNLLGVLGTVVYRFSDRANPGVFVFGNVGMLRHSYSSEQFEDEEASNTGLAIGGGAGFSMPMGRATLHGTASYLTGTGDVEGTSIIPVQVGISFPLRNSSR